MGMRMKKVELLSPAGNFKALEGALYAGADAVYLGGDRYGARAYADNFTREEIIRGIHLAHVFGKKIYLTVNTLVKEKELGQLYDFLLPFYEAGVDGVIVQDLGALCFIREHFPNLLLHASTQMTVTGWRGAKLLEQEGVSRIVPARELSLDEIAEMKRHTGVEIEAFIHGAMCYAYSGQCLFSSILGGRSGNRGRCAQPCRLAYRTEKNQKERYLLSMRDMCTLEILPELIGAGIDSFKIEGRMKRPEYAAGVTAVYRKYIDRYYGNLSMTGKKGGCKEGSFRGFQIEKKDLELLHSLYIRSHTGEGYYHCHNGKEMLTLTSPAYTETDEKILQKIQEDYLNKKLSVPVSARVVLEAGQQAVLVLKGGGEAATRTGDVVQAAQKQPLSDEKIVSQIKKSGQSLLSIDHVEVDRRGDIFIPVGALNRLRREASDSLEMCLAEKNGAGLGARTARKPKEGPDGVRERKVIREEKTNQESFALHAFVLTNEQFFAAAEWKVERIYLDYSLLAGGKIEKEILNGMKKSGISLYAATPIIARSSNEKFLSMIGRGIRDGILSGVLIRNLESFAFFENDLLPEQIILNDNIYLWNRETLRFFEGRAAEYYLPVECNAGEWKELEMGNGGGLTRSARIYGRLPMMVSANCVKKTSGGCDKTSGMFMMEDRYGKWFPVYNDCMSCYNVIYNSVPLSLHGMFREKKIRIQYGRMDFTTETSKETDAVIGYFKDLIGGKRREPVYDQYTMEHYKRGVE